MYWLSMPLCKELNMRQRVSLLSANVMYMVNHASECGNKYYAITVGVSQLFCKWCTSVWSCQTHFFHLPIPSLCQRIHGRSRKGNIVSKVYTGLIKFTGPSPSTYKIWCQNYGHWFAQILSICPRDWGSVSRWVCPVGDRGHPWGTQLTMCG